MKILRKLKNLNRFNKINVYQKRADVILNKNFSQLTDVQLLEVSKRLQETACSSDSLNDVVEDAFALVCEAATRKLGLTPYPVQIIAALAMHDGFLVEQYTGEGKTLSAVMPAYTNALQGKGVHILTFNDYLARRDAEWMRPIYELLGLSVKSVQANMSLAEKREAYAADITYVTAKEAGFDYLRDCIAHERDDIVHRQFHFVIVDEADSLLLDEARVPLVIASDAEQSELKDMQLNHIVEQLVEQEHYEFDEFKRNVYLNESGVAKAEQLLHCVNLYDETHSHLLHQLNCALHVELLLTKDVDYIVRDGHIELIDKLTGRVAKNRFLPNGLQAASKEGLSFVDGGRILGMITLQHFISLYPKISGMTATASTAQLEFREIYNLQVLSVPPNKKNQRIDLPHKIFTHKEAKFQALLKEITAVHTTGRPILIGTSSVEESEHLSHALISKGLPCHVLNAKNDEKEAKIIACAGMYGAITVSTNMAGRGVDIKLGNGNPAQAELITKLGGLHVIGTHIHENIRIDNQLRGRAGRQGDPGSSIFFISLEDDLLTAYDIQGLVPTSIRNMRQDEPLHHPILLRKIDHIQRVVSGQNFHIQQELNQYSDMVEDQRKILHKERYQLLSDITKSRTEVKLKLYLIDKYWADHLSFASYIREGIHLESLANKNPIDEFHQQISQSFNCLYDLITDEYDKLIVELKGNSNPNTWEKLGIKPPSSTRTYIMNDHYIENTRSGWGATTVFAFWISLFVKPIIKGTK